MTYLEALDSDALRDHPHRWRYAELCESSDEFKREGYRRIVVEMAGGESSYPPLATQAGNLARAVGRAVANAVTGQPVIVSAEEQARRLAICTSCPEYDPIQVRCRRCGCRSSIKARIASESCPLNKWMTP
jgi:hypothetical protein